MKILLMATAVIEIGAGVALMVFPMAVVKLLLDSPLDSPATVIVGRMVGAALIALGIACWIGRDDGRSGASRGLVSAMLFYNFAIVALFVFAAMSPGLRGELLWPAVILHGAMAAGCLACMRRKRTTTPVGR